MKLSRGGVDCAKNVYQLHGVDRSGKTIWKRRLKRHQWSLLNEKYMMEVQDISWKRLNRFPELIVLARRSGSGA